MSLIVRARDLPPVLVTAIETSLGAGKANRWLGKAAAQVNDYAADWGVDLDTVLTGGALSLCVVGTDRSGTRVVLKVPSADDTGRREIAALLAWDGRGCPLVLRRDESTSVFLMEYLVADPGAQASGEDVHRLAAGLHSSHTGSLQIFPALRENVEMRVGWAEERFSADGYTHHLPDLQAAREMASRLLQTSTTEVLLHGDLQRKNLLMTPAGLRTLDPHPCIGDPVFDFAFWLGLVHHDNPLVQILSEHPASAGTEEYRRLLCWTWAISVIENRPYETLGVRERQGFINDFRAEAIRTLGML